MDNFLTIKDIGSLLRVERGTVLRWIASGKLRAFKPGGGRFWRIRERDLKRFVSNSTFGQGPRVE